MQANRNLPQFPQDNQPVIAWGKGFAVIWTPQPIRCSECGALHHLFVNRQGSTLCVCCDGAEFYDGS